MAETGQPTIFVFVAPSTHATPSTSSPVALWRARPDLRAVPFAHPPSTPGAFKSTCMCDARRCGASIATLGAVARAYANRNRTLVIRTVPRHVYCGTVRERVTGVGWRGAGCGDATLGCVNRADAASSPAAPHAVFHSQSQSQYSQLSTLNSQTQHSQLSALTTRSLKEWL